ncbi:uncharacterized protein LOC111389999 [Olea europaea var. sylvestris]|uniref:uncharacterized protein LOC111389999 n=1 Tax=Olea europaea var. sylvestris TaxID=158386 RepID=UPI000C1D0926|nr:uncharacterized protein LOC111389999 [Olea europaea var. sylvestris]
MEHQAELFHSAISPYQWSGQISQQDYHEGIKERLSEAKGKWADKLPGVLWSYRTTIRKPTRETPFSLAYGMEVVIPIEIGHSNISHFNSQVRTRTFKENEWVLQRVFQNTKEVGARKLAENREGLYLIMKVLRHGASKLYTLDDRDITNSWNTIHLHKYYF